MKTLLPDQALGSPLSQLAACKGVAEVELAAVLLLSAGKTRKLVTLCLPGLVYMHIELLTVLSIHV